MIRVLIPTDPEFKIYEKEIKNLYQKNQKAICDINSFSFIKNKTFFFMFIKNNELIGAIYYFMENDKLYLNGFSKRKTYYENLICLKMSLKWFNCDIYAEAQNRASALCLLRCGFKRVKNNLFLFKVF